MRERNGPQAASRASSARRAASRESRRDTHKPNITPMAVSRLPASAYGPLGRVHVRVSRIGFGGYRVDDRSDVHREALREALVSGITLVDTSSNYADGHSEI